MMVRSRSLGQTGIIIIIVLCFFLLRGGRVGKPDVNDVRAGATTSAPAEEENELTAHEVVPLSDIENDLLFRPPIDIALIFTKTKDNFGLQYKFRVAVGSMLRHVTVPLRLHLITDDEGFSTASTIIREIQEGHQYNTNHVKLVYVSAEDFAMEIKSSVRVLQDFFTSHRDTYYRDALFFFSIHLHNLLPGLERVILMDIDIKVKGDIAELYSHFDHFVSTNVIGMAFEQSPVYRHLLAVYRNENKKTLLGSPKSEGGFPGYNSGVVLVNIPRLRQSEIIRNYLERSKLEIATKKYGFQGHLGDQDLYTLIAFDHPELFYTLPCGWNRQLCEWWRKHGYSNVFDQYFNCTDTINIIHGNCKTEIPDGDD
ncbi:xyloside xylosyltransferase [Oratosquilla oratoria]|uniref:xyloside xylosyltransferase n=1 Tax=Oratosquilla oratoria TaxID=337810 RepID=UPI003F76A0A5